MECRVWKMRRGRGIAWGGRVRVGRRERARRRRASRRRRGRERRKWEVTRRTHREEEGEEAAGEVGGRPEEEKDGEGGWGEGEGGQRERTDSSLNFSAALTRRSASISRAFNSRISAWHQRRVSSGPTSLPDRTYAHYSRACPLASAASALASERTSRAFASSAALLAEAWASAISIRNLATRASTRLANSPSNVLLPPCANASSCGKRRCHEKATLQIV